MNILVVGITGQTGAYVTRLLLGSGHVITGTSRDKKHANLSNLARLGIKHGDIHLISLDPSDARQVFSLLASHKYDAIVNLAGQTSVGLSFEQPAQALDSIATSCLNFIEALRAFRLDTKYFNASSAECFGDTGSEIADESTPFRPNSPYAVAKTSAFYLTRLAREAYGLRAFSGILSNHESPLRGSEFVTSKIFRDLKRIKEGSLDKITLGNLNTVRDWGFAADYAVAIQMMVESDMSCDYIIATGCSHSLGEMVKCASKMIGINKEVVIDQSEELIRPLDIQVSRLSPQRIADDLGWRPLIDFESLIYKLANNICL